MNDCGGVVIRPTYDASDAEVHMQNKFSLKSENMK